MIPKGEFEKKKKKKKKKKSLLFNTEEHYYELTLSSTLFLLPIRHPYHNFKYVLNVLISIIAWLSS